MIANVDADVCEKSESVCDNLRKLAKARESSRKLAKAHEAFAEHFGESSCESFY